MSTGHKIATHKHFVENLEEINVSQKLKENEKALNFILLHDKH